VNCHAGCTLDAVVGALGMTAKDLFPKATPSPSITRVYEIRDVNGRLHALHERTDGPDGIRFAWRQPTGEYGLNGRPTAELPLYGSERLQDRPGETVFVCEGEKAADALNTAGKLAIATVCGANVTPSSAVLEPLRGRKVILWPDADEKGSGIHR
jgi:putative DNA primase/helicase